MPRRWAWFAAVAVALIAAGLGSSDERAAAQDPAGTTNHIEGTVFDEEGTPIAGEIMAIRVSRRIGPVSVYRETSQSTHTASDGTFTLSMDAGPDVVEHLLYANTQGFSECTVSGHGDGEIRGPAIFRPDEGDIEGLRITLSGTPSTRLETIHCQFATPLLRIEGRILGHDGRPLRGVRVRAKLAAGSDSWTAPATGSSGRFTVEVPDGTYLLKPFVDYGDGECRLGTYRDGTVDPDDIPAERLVVADSHVTGITMRLPQPLEELCRRVSGVVTDATGEPLGGQRPSLAGHGILEGYRRDRQGEEDGTFTLYVAEGTYSVDLLAGRIGDRCHLDPALLDIGGDGPGLFTVGDRGVADLHVIVTGVPNPPDALTCSIPPASITTRLQPGWNLVGWTDVEVGIESLFAALPDLQATRAWDAEAQAFRATSRRNGAVSGDLGQLSPGMGLWLFIDGEEDVEWRRPVVPESARTTLAEGWNLIAWSGEDGAAPGEAFASLGDEFEVAAAWDPATQQFGLFAGVDGAQINTLGDLSRGEGIWIYTSTGRDWLQPGSPGTPTE